MTQPEPSRRPPPPLKCLVFAALLFLGGCPGDGQQPPPRHDGENEAGSINCTIDVRNCEPGQKR